MPTPTPPHTSPTATAFAGPSPADFIARWQGVQLTDATELSSSQTFVLELCALLGVPTPLPTHAQDYVFERPISFAHGDGSTSPGRIDCYRQGSFVWESKKLRYSSANSARFDAAMLTARAQAERYARALPPAEGRPPFLLVVDVGNVIELYAEFSKSGATYTPFPDPRSHRIRLADLAQAEVRERLRQIWLDADALNPARTSARVTRQVAEQLGRLASSLEHSGHSATHVAAFLTRCLFCMFAEDVELLPKINGVSSFLALLEQHGSQPHTLQQMLRALWADMDRGGFSTALATQVRRFNGKLFKEPSADGYSLLLNAEQVALLTQAARSSWREVEPAIFGTLLERALSSSERHALGAHYTPRAYVERLVLPTIIEPLRVEWANVQAAAVLLAQEAKLKDAVALVRQFHHQLCSTRVLDPACGSGNFLYVTLEHLKRLEGEVLNQLEAFGQVQSALALEGETVTLQQLRGIEINERAAALAELVLWIGYLQWQIRTRGDKGVSEPVVHDYGNIECRDAVLAWADLEPAYDAQGQLLTRWDGRSTKPHPVTGLPVPDEAAIVAQWRYILPKKAKWPQAHYIVGNPPFIGAASMRAALGDGYVETLRRTWPEVPESADFVMYWWQHAASLVAKNKALRFGLITTNSLRQTFNRRVVQAALDDGLALGFAIPDHPWVDNANGAAVRIAMTVGLRSATKPRKGASKALPGRLLHLRQERTGEHGEVSVELGEQSGAIHADLSVGADVSSAVALEANDNISSPGVKLHGAGFIVTAEEAQSLGLGRKPGLAQHIRQYRHGRDLTDTPRGVLVIDLFGLRAQDVRNQYPEVYQHLLERVKPERDANNRATYRDNWWIFGEPRRELRPALAKLPRYIATVETAKHRCFQFLDASILPDNMLIAIASDDPFHLGVLSSPLHAAWAWANGGSIGMYVGNVRYNKSRCFETFPFPSEDTGLTPALRSQIGQLAEQIDAHRKRQQAAHPGLTLTGMYNVLEALRAGRALLAKEKTIHQQGLLAVLHELHQALDAAVLQAYGWADLGPSPVGAGPAQAYTALLLERLLALNTRRAQEEHGGVVRWLRPAYQNAVLQNQELLTHIPRALQADLALETEAEANANGLASGGVNSSAANGRAASGAAASAPVQAWPAELPEQVRAVAQVLAASTQAQSLAALEAQFKGRGPWKRSLPRILQTLEALGRAQREGALWRALTGSGGA